MHTEAWLGTNYLLGWLVDDHGMAGWCLVECAAVHFSWCMAPVFLCLRQPHSQHQHFLERQGREGEGCGHIHQPKPWPPPHIPPMPFPCSDYLLSLTGDAALRLLGSPGKSGSVFFLSDDDRWVWVCPGVRR